MRAVSLFSGVGGFDLGFERAGIKTVLQVENDKHCLAVLEQHWPDVERITDVRGVGVGRAEHHEQGEPHDAQASESEPARLTGDVHLVYGGFPCQDVSVAGARAGLAGDRSGLWFEFHRIVRELRPRWVCIENVPGLLSSNGGADFAVILAGLDELGFDAAWAVLDSQHFGVPQRRRRVFIVGGPRGRGAEQVLSLCESCGGNPETGDPPREGTTGALSAGTLRAGGVSAGNNPTGGYLADIAYAVSPARGTGDYIPTLQTSHGADNLAHAVTASAGHHGHSSPRGDGSDNLVAETVRSHPRPGSNSTGQLAYALTARDAKGPLPDRSLGNAVVAEGVRRLTPRECERLQGFPDDWTADQADSHRYRQMGNAVTVPVAEWIGHRLIEVDRLPVRAHRRR